jgi:hypothetical protein
VEPKPDAGKPRAPVRHTTPAKKPTTTKKKSR